MSASVEVKKSAKGFRFREGDPVGIINQPRLGEGIVRYVGQLEGYDGYWVGIELIGHWGKCNGTLKGVRYFSCEPKQGIFARIQDCDKPDVCILPHRSSDCFSPQFVH
mmetsp:Transcript_51374/g.128916  ORF Transcript_51374/g.128916 Transcript_51374/m.128916 type:complete len:108 (+) Transcript_51374:51-374(+)